MAVLITIAGEVVLWSFLRLPTGARRVVDVVAMRLEVCILIRRHTDGDPAVEEDALRNSVVEKFRIEIRWARANEVLDIIVKLC